MQHEELSQFFSEARILCFGERTAQVLCQYGMKVELVQEVRTAQEFLPYVRGQLAHGTFILLPGPKTRAFSFEKPLIDAGFLCRTVDLYETTPQLTFSDGRIPTPNEQRQLIDSLSGTICFASPSACTGFVQCLSPPTNRLGRDLKAVAIGPTTAAACRLHFEQVYVAERNSVASLVVELCKN